MNLDDRIQRAVDAVIQQARTLLETEVRALADHAVASSTEEREAALAEAARAKAAEIEEAVRKAREAAQAEHEAAEAEHEVVLQALQAAAERQQELAVHEARSAALAEAAAALAAVKAEDDQALAAIRAEADQAIAAAKAEFDRVLAAAKTESEQALAAKAESDQALAATRAESEQALAAKAESDRALAAAKAEFEQALAGAKTESEQALAAKAESDQALAAARAEFEQGLAAAQAEFGRALAATKAESGQALAAAKSEFDRALSAAKAESEQALAAAAEGEQMLADAQAEAAGRLAAAESEIAGLHVALASARALAEPAAGKVNEAVTEAQLGERRADLACASRLLEATRRFDHASSLTEILDSLADYAHAEVGRAALFMVQGGRLRGYRMLGFENVPEDGRGVDLDLGAVEIIKRAVHTGGPAATSDLVARADQQGAGRSVPPFLALAAGRVGLAMPVHVGHRVVAVLYADEGAGELASTPSAWPEIVEVAARHAGRCLEVLTTSKAASVRSGAGAEAAAHKTGQAPAEEEGARRYARLLVAEIKLYNEVAVVEGKQARNILARLRPEIDRARRLYEEKFPAAGGARVNWFDEELVKTLADGDASLLGK